MREKTGMPYAAAMNQLNQTADPEPQDWQKALDLELQSALGPPLDPEAVESPFVIWNDWDPQKEEEAGGRQWKYKLDTAGNTFLLRGSPPVEPEAPLLSSYRRDAVARDISGRKSGQPPVAPIQVPTKMGDTIPRARYNGPGLPDSPRETPLDIEFGDPCYEPEADAQLESLFYREFHPEEKALVEHAYRLPRREPQVSADFDTNKVYPPYDPKQVDFEGGTYPPEKCLGTPLTELSSSELAELIDRLKKAGPKDWRGITREPTPPTTPGVPCRPNPVVVAGVVRDPRDFRWLPLREFPEWSKRHLYCRESMSDPRGIFWGDGYVWNKGTPAVLDLLPSVALSAISQFRWGLPESLCLLVFTEDAEHPEGNEIVLAAVPHSEAPERRDLPAWLDQHFTGPQPQG